VKGASGGPLRRFPEKLASKGVGLSGAAFSVSSPSPALRKALRGSSCRGEPPSPGRGRPLPPDKGFRSAPCGASKPGGNLWGKERPALGVEGQRGHGLPVLPRERSPLPGARTRGRAVSLLWQGEAYKEGGVIPVHFDPALGRAVIVTIPRIAARCRPDLVREAYRLADLVVFGRQYEVASGQVWKAWRVAETLEELRHRRH